MLGRNLSQASILYHSWRRGNSFIQLRTTSVRIHFFFSQSTSFKEYGILLLLIVCDGFSYTMHKYDVQVIANKLKLRYTNDFVNSLRAASMESSKQRLHDSSW
mmetsp:Transcript_5789/g.10448  ORF Transcript_5789/g.10448 Transcript_5789/m.10448 type:complete len:103 (+) Transcript_5789:313-621(+)